MGQKKSHHSFLSRISGLSQFIKYLVSMNFSAKKNKKVFSGRCFCQNYYSKKFELFWFGEQLKHIFCVSNIGRHLFKKYSRCFKCSGCCDTNGLDESNRGFTWYMVPVSVWNSKTLSNHLANLTVYEAHALKDISRNVNPTIFSNLVLKVDSIKNTNDETHFSVA